jgi:smad nuclear-interacting protein 1
MSSDRKRNRWGGPAPSNTTSSSHRAPVVPAVSDQEALNALLSTANARQQEREERPRKQQKDGDRKGGGRRGDNDNRRGDRRGEDNPGPSGQDLGRPNDSYYGPEGGGGGGEQQGGESKNVDDDDLDSSGEEKQKPNFGLSGALAKDDDKGNVYKGVLLKFSEPPEARAPNTQWRLYVFKGDENLETLHIAKQSAYLFGRNDEIADITLRHASSSSQHAVLQYRALPNGDTGNLRCCPYLMDLESTNGSFINGVKIEAARYYQLKKGDELCNSIIRGR